MSDIERYFRMLSECNQILLRANDESTLAQQICDTIVTVGGFDSALMGLLKDNKLDLSITSGVLKKYQNEILVTTDDEKYSSGASGRALKDGQTHIYNDVTHEKDYDVYRKILDETGVKANLAVPIKADGKIIGTLGIYSKHVGIFKDDEKRLFEDLAGDLGYGISSIRTRKRMESLNEMLKRIRMANQRIARENDLERLLQGFCEDLLGAKLYNGVVIDYDGTIYCAGDCCSVIRENIENGNLDLGLCTDDLQMIDYKCPLHVDSKPGCIKIKSGDKIYGNLFVYTRKDLFDDPNEVALLKELAGELGMVIDRILSRSEALRFGMVVQNISEGVRIVDPDTFKFTLVNTSALKRLGYTLEEMKEMTLADITPEFTLEQLKKMFEPLKFHEKEYVQFETVNKGKDGTTYPVMITGFYNDDPLKPSYFVIATDLSGVKGFELKINSLAEALVVVLSGIVEVKDPYTAGHQRRVSALAVEIAKEMHLNDNEIKSIKIAGLLHDIGKISVPSDILTKPSKLKRTEFELIKDHVEDGYKILKTIPDFEDIAIMERQHHERLNGTGYPLGIKGDEITIGGRILAVADVVEAMASHRPYRPALGLGMALDEIRKNAGILYDKEVVDACERVFRRGWRFYLI